MYAARTQVSTAANALVSFIHQNAYGYLADVESLAYAVFDISSPAKELAPVEVVARTELSVELAPTGQKLSTGRYFAPLEIGEEWDLGTHQLIWYYDLGDGEIEVKDTLVVTDEAFGPPLWYIGVQDVYDAGLDPDEFTTVQVRTAIKRSQEYIDRVTGRHFAPVYKTLRVDGRGGPKLRLREPIIAVESVSPDDEYITDETLLRYSTGHTVYNRHIRLGMLAPDDRNNPKIEISYGSRPFGPYGRWPDGSQDVRVAGVFGYTDPDGSPYGRTPELIQTLTKLLVSLYIFPLGSADEHKVKNQWKVVEEKTDLQSVRFGGTAASSTVYKGPGSSAFFTGDDEIDALLLQFKAGPGMTGA